jgi:UDP-2,3-diacylglucosamine pyrophosphatase LpxH
MPTIKMKNRKFPRKKGKKSEPRTVNLVLSDLHFGSDLDKAEVGIQWGIKEEARSFAKVVKNVCSYKLQYRSQTKLAVFLLGDIIENELHGRTSADLLHIQTCRAIHLLTQAVGRFAEAFPEVEIYFAVGNHGRDTSVHKQRATHMKFNALETTIYYAVKVACRNLKNVKFFQPKTPYIMMESQGHKVYATHGDTHLNPGNPGRNINTGSLEGQINRINSSLKDHEEFKVFVCGHVHMPTILQLANGAHLIVNGALTPPNAFAQSLNIMESRQTQVMWESTPERAVGDTRIIDVTNDPDTPDLDSIIQPFPGLDV